MKLTYRKLLGIRLRHSFYRSGDSTGDLEVRPTGETSRLLTDYGIVFRPAPHGADLFARVEPDTAPPALYTPLDIDELRLHFTLTTLHPWMGNVTSLPAHRPGRTVFYWNNLRDDQSGGRLHLSDSVAAARVGPALTQVAGETLEYPFASAVSSAEIRIDDLFGNRLATIPFNLGSETTRAYRLDLTGIAGLVPGRYRAHDSHGGSLSFFYTPVPLPKRLLGVVEVFSSTTGLEPLGNELVPVGYRFLDGVELTGIGDYHIQLESRSTTWRYRVVDRYDSGSITLSQVNVVDPGGVINFSKVVQASEVVFESTALIALSETPPGLELRHGATKLRDLPYPRLNTPVSEVTGAGDHVSEMFVNV
jgi:hypothetical protein